MTTFEYQSTDDLYTTTEKHMLDLASREALKHIGNNPTVGIDHQQTIKTRGVQMVKKTGDIVGDKASSAKPELFHIVFYTLLILAIIAGLYLSGVRL